MSAFVVTNCHIAYIVEGMYTLDQHRRKTMSDGFAKNVTGQILLDENIKSVRYRYPNDPFGSDKYDHESDSAGIGKIDPVVMLKAIACLNYQSCEHPGWETSEAKKYLTSAQSIAIEALPGYEEAPWGIS